MILVAGVVLFVLTGDDESVVEEVGPVVDPDVESAVLFVEALVRYDVDLALTYLAADADLSGLGGESVLRRETEWFESAGVRLFVDSCERRTDTEAGTLVRCELVFFALHSGGIGLRFEGGNFDLTVRDGEVVRGSMEFDLAEMAPEVWEPFADWMAANAAADARVMYKNWPQRDEPRLTDESAGLWDRYTREFIVSSREAIAAFTNQVEEICTAAKDRLVADLTATGVQWHESWLDGGLAYLPQEEWIDAYEQAAPDYLEDALVEIGTLDPPAVFRTQFDEVYAVFEQLPNVWRGQGILTTVPYIAAWTPGFRTCLLNMPARPPELQAERHHFN